MKESALTRLVLICWIALLTVSCQSITPRTWELPPNVKTLQVNGYEMAYLERGTGVPLVLVHGTITDYRYWTAHMEPFGNRYRTIAVSLRHFYPERWNGEGGDSSIRQHAGDLAAFISGLHTGPVHLVGESRGGDVALLMASAHPELLRSLVLMDPAPLEELLPKSPEATAEVEKRAGYVGAALERLKQGDLEGGVERFVDGLNVPGRWKSMPGPLKQSIRDNAWSIKSLLTDAREPFTCADAGKITVPVLLLTGQTSPRTYGVMMDALEPCIPKQEKITIPNAGHFMNRENPQAFHTAVLGFLAKH